MLLSVVFLSKHCDFMKFLPLLQRYFYSLIFATITNTILIFKELFEMVNIKFSISACFFAFALFSTSLYAFSTHNIFVITLSILSYAKWNTSTPALCVIDNPNYAIQFNQALRQQGLHYKISSIRLNELDRSACNAIFLSTFSPQEEQKIIHSQKQDPLLSFSSTNIACEIGSAFCLYTRNNRTSFKVNLDSLSQSKVRVDPRVLLLAKSAEQ